MGVLRKATTETTKIYLDEEQSEYIEVRKDISKKQFNALASAMPESGTKDGVEMNLHEATEFQRYLFGALVVGWSLPDPCTVEVYDELDTESATIIDEKVAGHFGSVMPSSAEGKSLST